MSLRDPQVLGYLIIILATGQAALYWNSNLSPIFKKHLKDKHDLFTHDLFITILWSFSLKQLNSQYSINESIINIYLSLPFTIDLLASTSLVWWFNFNLLFTATATRKKLKLLEINILIFYLTFFISLIKTNLVSF